MIYPNYTKKGRWWYKDQEIDGVVEKEEQHEIVFLEVKWSTVKYKRAKEILKKLQVKALGLEDKTKEYKVNHGLIAKTIEKKEELRREGYEIYGLEEILNILHD